MQLDGPPPGLTAWTPRPVISSEAVKGSVINGRGTRRNPVAVCRVENRADVEKDALLRIDQNEIFWSTNKPQHHFVRTISFSWDREAGRS